MKGIWMPVAFAALMGAGRDLFAGGPGTPIGPTSRVWITGASTIRRFTCEARQLDGTLSLHGIATRGRVLSGHNVTSEPSLAVAVEQLECGDTAMNRDLRKTMRSAAHPVITFHLATYSVDLTGAAPIARIAGEVTIAGVTRPVVITAAVAADSSGVLRVRGTHVLRMTDFGLEPPRRFGGLLRVRDRITVHFDIAPGTDWGAADDHRCPLAIPTVTLPNPGALHAVHD